MNYQEFKRTTNVRVVAFFPVVVVVVCFLVPDAIDLNRPFC